MLANPELGPDEIDRRAYSFCVLEALDRRDVFVTRSGPFTDPRARLLSGSAWTAARPEICAGLNLDPDPRQALKRLGAQLESAYRQTAERLPENVALQIAEIAGTDRPDLSNLAKRLSQYGRMRLVLVRRIFRGLTMRSVEGPQGQSRIRPWRTSHA